jgi:hypothetical protein
MAAALHIDNSVLTKNNTILRMNLPFLNSMPLSADRFIDRKALVFSRLVI